MSKIYKLVLRVEGCECYFDLYEANYKNITKKNVVIDCNYRCLQSLEILDKLCCSQSCFRGDGEPEKLLDLNFSVYTLDATKIDVYKMELVEHLNNILAKFYNSVGVIAPSLKVDKIPVRRIEDRFYVCTNTDIVI